MAKLTGFKPRFQAVAGIEEVDMLINKKSEPCDHLIDELLLFGYLFHT